MGTIIEVSAVLLSEWNENTHAKYLEENCQAADPQVSYSGLCTSYLIPDWFPLIVNIKSPGLDPPPFFQLPDSRDNKQPVMGAQLGMHNSCLSYLNPASNRTATEQGRLWVCKEHRRCSHWSQLLSCNWVFCPTTKFNASFPPRICPSLLHSVVSLVGTLPLTLHSSSEWWDCLHLPNISSPCCSLPRSIL